MRGTRARVFYDHFNVSSSTMEVELQLAVSELEKNVLTSEVQEYRPGTSEVTLTINGYLEGIDGGFEEALNTALDSGDRHCAIVLDYLTAPGAVYVVENAFANGITWTAPTNELMTVNGSVRGRAGGARGYFVYYEEDVTATGALASVQVSSLAASDTGKVYIFLHSVTGTLGTATIQIQGSANNTDWTTLATFSLTELRSDVESVTFNGSYIRANVTSMGGTTGLVFSVVVSETL